MKQITYAFIDAQNLNLGTSKDISRNGKIIYRGWKMDFKKFYIYLKNKFKIEKAFLFIGYIEGNQKLYQKLEQFGYKMIFKQTITNKQGITKGNVDAELVLYSAAKFFKEYSKAVIVSGDGDFLCLYDYLIENNKLKTIIIPNSLSASSLLKKYEKYKVFVKFEKNFLELKQKNGGRRA